MKNSDNDPLGKILKSRYFILVIHRQEHVVFNKKKTTEILNCIFDNIPKNLKCVFITHKTTSSFLNSSYFRKRNFPRNKVISSPRLPYSRFIGLLKNSEFLVTDGGSNQEEAYYLGKPCLILRNTTERIEGLGKNALLAYGNVTIVTDFLKGWNKYKKRRVYISRVPSKIIADFLFKKNKI